ncbi:uncharacterized protein LACBIDRAFT_324455 [Laccaria bicolor S238N-H82]|uniref:Predicted protein n=1 Tax=Laccaria bicolor (strain S238N-H82 / ATCC MYA-4686) TaxID=486041 RepID=B0D1V8_LACBS|nr:uncharacterized protein LACBIDRAFT_324455 [Laccaria bicolor S238N-H82]EDR12058.1 predicted protein [Laccaria bicolor S238N-H82]|eukprot:XP_001877955.1 predicted protein [Laccaria bicolor S238N-H82]
MPHKISIKTADFRKTMGTHLSQDYINRLKIWSLYPNLFLASDADTNRRKNVARVYMQKLFSNNRWRYLRARQKKIKSGARDPVDVSRNTRGPSTAKPAAKPQVKQVNPKLSVHAPPVTERKRGFKPSYLPIPTRAAATPPLDESTAPVRHFLETCIPPMSHFLPKFIAFGCTDEHFLHAVHLCTDDGIDTFLKTVSSFGDNEFTAMDIFVLKNHIRRH